MRTIQKIFADYGAIKKQKASFIKIFSTFITSSGFRAVVLYRIGFSFRMKKLRLLANLVERFMHHACNCWISTNAIIGEGFTIRHVGCIIIGGKVRIGTYCDIRQGITIGGNTGKQDEFGNTQPTLGNNILIGAGAQVLGPIKIGDGCIIGANAVVISNFDRNTVIGGVPARVLKVRKDEIDDISRV